MYVLNPTPTHTHAHTRSHTTIQAFLNLFHQIVRTNLGAEPVQRTITTNVWIGPSQVSWALNRLHLNITFLLM